MADRPPSPHLAGEAETRGADAPTTSYAAPAARPNSSVPPPPPRPPRLVTSWGEDDDDDEDDEDDDVPSEDPAPTPAPAWPLASPALVAGRARRPPAAAAAAAAAAPVAAATPPQPKHARPPTLDTNPESRFELLDELGRGSHGAVYAAHDGLTGRLVAVKVVAAVGADAGALAREVDALVGCAHPAVVQHIGAWRSRRGDMWIAMELCDGGSVADAVAAARSARLPAPPPGAPPRPPPPPAAAAAAALGPLSEAEVALVIGSAAAAIAHLHARGQVHRDVKCGNLLLCGGGGGGRGRGEEPSLVKLADFGVAAPLSRSVSRRASFVGTPHWMAPEVIREESGYGAAVDVWGLGIAAIEAAEGVPPRWDAHPVRVLFQISADPPPRLGDGGGGGGRAAHWSSSFIDFVDACLVKDPALRPAAADVCGHPFVAAVTGAGEDARAAWLARRGPRCAQGAPDAPALSAGRARLAQRASAAAAARVPARTAAGQRSQRKAAEGGAWPGGAWPGLAPPGQEGNSGGGAWWSASAAVEPVPATPPSLAATATTATATTGSGGGGRGRGGSEAGAGSADGSGAGSGGGDYAAALAAAGGLGGWGAAPPPVVAPPAALPEKPPTRAEDEEPTPAPPTALAAAISAARALGVQVDALPVVRAAVHAPAAALLDGGAGGGVLLPLGWGESAALREEEADENRAPLPFAVAQVRRVAAHGIQALKEGGGSEGGVRAVVAVVERVGM